jgi:hypothetical protein
VASANASQSSPQHDDALARVDTIATIGLGDHSRRSGVIDAEGSGGVA